MNIVKKMARFVPRFCLKFYLKGKTIKSTSTKKSKKILLKIKGYVISTKWDRACLKFNYRGGFVNEGYFFNLKDLEVAYRCFMEIVPEFIGGAK